MSTQPHKVGSRIWAKIGRRTVLAKLLAYTPNNDGAKVLVLFDYKQVEAGQYLVHLADIFEY